MPETRDISMHSIAGDLRGGRLRSEMRTSWAIAVLYRVPSLPFVWLAAKARLSPTAITLAALVLALTMPVQALFVPLELAGWCVALSGIVFQVLDCADGTLARVTGQSSKRGADLDFLVDMMQWFLLYLAIGILADRSFESGWAWTALAAAAAWTRLFARIARDTLARQTEDGPPVPLTPAQWPVAFIAGLSGVIPFLALAGPYLWLSVWLLLLYAFLDLGDALMALRHSDAA